MTVKVDRMREAANRGFLNATDLADYLVGKGIPFRDAYKLVGEIVLHAENQKKTLEEISLEEYKSYSEVFDSDLYEFINLENCLNKRSVYGGPSANAVMIQIDNIEKTIK